MDDQFLAALLARRRRRLCGRWLEPYCYGHWSALYAIASPFLAPADSGATISAGDLLAAVRICSMRWPFDTEKALRLCPLNVLRAWWIQRKPARLARLAQALQDHINDHESLPEFWEEESLDPEQPNADPSDSRTLSAPAVLGRICGLIKRTTITEERAWSMSVGMVHWINATLDEMDGATRRIQREDDFTNEPPPIEETLTEKQIFQQAVQHMGREKALLWRAVRRKAKRREKAKLKKQKGVSDERRS